MQYPQIVNQFTLDKVKININPNHPYQTLTIYNQIQKPPEQLNLIRIRSTIIIREALNHCLKPKGQLFKIWIKDKSIAVNIQTREGVYSVQSMNYLFFIQTKTNPQYIQSLIIEQAKGVLNATEISFELNLHLQGKTINELLTSNEVWVEFGSKKSENVVKFQVASLSLLGINESDLGSVRKSNLQNKFQFVDNKASSPLGVIQTSAQIYQSLKIQEFSVKNIESYIAQMDPYSSPPFEKENRLYLCHDMDGGYKQDRNFANNQGQPNKNIYYRALHLQQSEIFNYFSHYNITIPPKHWRVACKTAKTKCLGTFIIEQPVYNEKTLTSQQFALFLVALAKKCQFDGYLMNIETMINDVSAFKKWLGYLTAKIHQHIPNSAIIWYDSISQYDGVIRYQNALTQQNYQFYAMTDGLFTNYWWNEGLLMKDVQLKANHPNRLYVGNDCFGRNTYGGGMYNIYTAANKILEYKNDLSISLFAPCFTYQGQAQKNRQLFHLNQLSMYKGVKIQTIVIDNWKIDINNGNGWKKEGDWWVTSYEICQRSAVFNFPPLDNGAAVHAQLMACVMANPASPQSPYTIILQVLDEAGNIIYQTDNNVKKAPAKEEIMIYQITITEELVGNKPYAIKAIESGKSNVYWAGHFGPRFKDEKLYVQAYEKDRHWINKIAVRQVTIGENYHSLCNMGLGDSFFYQGLRMQPNYDYLADFDLPHTHVINHPFDTEMSYKSVFIGGSCLLMKKQTLKLLKVLIPKGLNLKKEYFLLVAVKDTLSIEIVFKYISKNQEDRIFSAKMVSVQDVNEWKVFTFQMITTLIEVKSDIRSIIDIVSPKQPYLLGSIKILSLQPKSIQVVACRLQVSREYTPTNFYYLNVILKAKSYRRLLLIVQSIANFAYFELERAAISNIAIQKTERLQIKVLDVDSSLDHITICQRTIESQEIAKLILNGFIDF